MGRGQELLNLVKSIKQQKELEDIGQTISEQIKPENIKAGVEVFGVQGDANIVDTSEGTIDAENITPDAIAFSKGKKITGTMLATTAENPLVISGNYTALNQENPYFLLRKPNGSNFGSDIVKVNAAAIKPEWIEGKNLILRYNFDSTTNKGQLELAITDWGNRFAFSYNGAKLEFTVKDSLTGESKSAQTYRCTATKDELLTLTPDKWEGPYGGNLLGGINTLYAYSRDASIRTTSHGGSDGIPSNNQIIAFEKNITGYDGRSVYTPAGGKEIVYLPKPIIATEENITPEKIVAGNTVLGVEGNATEFIPNSTFIAEAVEKYSGPTIANAKVYSASNTTEFSYSVPATIGKRVIAFLSLLNNPSYTANPATPNEIEGWSLVHRLQSGKYNNWRNWTTYIYTKIAESETETITFTTQETCGAADIVLAACDSNEEIEVLTSVTGWKALTGYTAPIKIGDIIFDSYMTVQDLTVTGPKYTSYTNKRAYLLVASTEANQISLDRGYDYTHNTVVLRFRTQDTEVLKPENIKKGVKILNIQGELEAGVDTSDATATKTNLEKGKTAYVNNEKIEGTLEVLNSESSPYFLTIGHPSYAGYGKNELIAMNQESSNVLYLIGGNNYNTHGTAYEIPVNSLPIDITDKNILIRYYPKFNGTHDSIEFAYTNKENYFISSYHDGTYDIDCKNPNNQYISFTKYRLAQEKLILSELTPEQWKEVASLSGAQNMNHGYAYSTKNVTRDDILTGLVTLRGAEDYQYAVKTQVGTSTLQAIVKDNATLIAKVNTNELIAQENITADKIVEGNNILGIEGAYKKLDTSDATASANEILQGYSAYTNGEKINGAVPFAGMYSFSSAKFEDSDKVLKATQIFTNRIAFEKDSKIELYLVPADLANFIGLTADKIKAGETILGIIGTYTGEDTNGSSHNGGTG